MSPDVYDPPRLPPPPRPVAADLARPPRLWLHLLLFLLTFLSAMIANAVPNIPGSSIPQVLAVLRHHPDRLLDGLPFAVALMAILLAHEMGHYVTSRWGGVDQSLPYFLPAPNIFGTFGAIILMRSLPRDRTLLLKVAVAGPFAGMLLAVPLTAWGLAHSAAADVGQLAPDDYIFGTSLLFSWLKTLFAPGEVLLDLHPVALAGWVGLFQTSINLIPAAQLDGGHIAYALFGRRHERISLSVAVALLVLGMFSMVESGASGGIVWVLWAMLLFILGLRHPPVRDERIPLSVGQRLMGFTALLLFIVTFTPAPLTLAKDLSTEPVVFDEQPQPMERGPLRRHVPARPPEEFRL